MTSHSGRLVMGHPVLNANVRHAALALAEAGLLHRFFTGVDTTDWTTRLPRSLVAELHRRVLPEAVHARTSTLPLLELARIVASRVPRHMNPFDLHQGMFSVQRRFEAVDRRLAGAIDSSRVSGVYAFEDGAANAFQVAEAAGKARIYDLPIGYWRTGRRLFSEEADHRPGWAGTLDGLQDSDWKLERKDRELELASTVLVASTFTARTLRDFPGNHAEAHVIPYGTPAVASPRTVDKSSPVRVIYVGSVGQRKGIADLLDALELVTCPTEFTVIGQPVGESRERDQRMQSIRWIHSAPHVSVLREIAGHDVLVLPSLFEGFGLVLTEALSQGTPIIATDHTAAPDLLSGIDDAGWVVPIRDPESIASHISGLADSTFREHTRERALWAAQRRTWDAYRATVASVATGAL